MAPRSVDTLFNARSLALVGASAREGSAGLALYRNVLRGGFEGPIGLVNPSYSQIDGRPCVARLADLSFVPQLVVVVAPRAAALEAATEAARLGSAAAIVVTPDDPADPVLTQGLRALAQATGMRALGPGCLGFIAPAARLDVSLAAQGATPGDLAIISQSSAVAAALGAWANDRGVGFSGLVSTGAMADVDLADLLDHFASDEPTRAILLFIETVGDVQAFMSAARAAARAKPVIVLKAGRRDGGRRGEERGMTHAAALADPDAVFDAACRRAGALRVGDIDALFDAAEALGRIKPFRGRRLAVLANGPGVGQLAADRTRELGGETAAFDEATLEAIRRALPPSLAPENPVDIGGDAGPERLRGVLDAVLASKSVDVAMVIHAPTALSRSVESAQALAQSVAAARKRTALPKPVFAIWYGATPETDAIFEKARVPHYTSGGVRGVMHLVRWSEAREFLMSAPPSLPADFEPDAAAARAIVCAALERAGADAAPRRMRLNTEEAARLLDAYGIPVAPARLAQGPEEAAELSRLFIARAGACVVKVASPDIEDRSTIGGIALGLTSADAVAQAARDVLARARAARPHARIEGVTVHPMIRRPDARELFAGLADDPVFGPVVVFGRGGKAVEIVADRALALPPLDLSLAHDLIRRTQVARLLADYRDVMRVDLDALALVLVKIAQLAADVPEVREIDLNPLLADPEGLVAVDARVAVEADPASRGRFGNARMAVAPYPKEQEARLSLRDGTPLFVRPVRPEDEETYKAFFEHVPPEDLRLRFFAPVRQFSHAFLSRLTQVDYARTYAVAAFHAETRMMLGGVRLVLDPDRTRGEYAILIAPETKGRGLGRLLMQRMIDAGRSFGLETIEGYVLSENDAMLRMCASLGFRAHHDPHERGVVRVVLNLET